MIQFAGTLALMVLLAWFLYAFCPPAWGYGMAENVRTPEGGVPLLGENALFEGTFRKTQDVPVLTEVVAVEGPPFSKALRVRTGKPTGEWWAIQLLLPTAAPVDTGDVLLASFWLRGAETMDETGEAYVRVLFQSDRPPWNKSLVAQWGAGKKWRKVECPFVAVESSAEQGAVFTFAFTSGPQAIEIGGVNLINYGKTVTIEALPHSVLTYAGREADAPWRESARERIDKLRKSDLRVLIKTAAGEPVSDAAVSVRMTRHAFPFGTAAAVASSNGHRFGHAYGQYYWFTPKDEENYDYWLRRWFTKVTPETALMTNGWVGHWPHLGREVAINAVKRYIETGFEVRGHILVWPAWQYFRLPGIEEAKNKPEVLGPMVINHVLDEVSAFKDTIFEWTLLNEPFAHHDLMDVLGREAMVDWFKAGRQASPNAKLYINDYAILSGGGMDLGHQDHYAETIQFLIDRGAPLDGIGLQGHFGDDVTPPDKVYEILDRFAAFGRDLQITEFDINSRDRALQADYMRDFMTVAFSHPAVCGFSLWGFWEQAHWRPDAALIDKDWRLKPNGEAFEKLVRGEWWTNAESTTGEDGTVSIRGFQGDYSITVQYGAEQREYSVKLPPEGTTLAIEW